MELTINIVHLLSELFSKGKESAYFALSGIPWAWQSACPQA